MKRVLIIGAGASGLVAAIAAARQHAIVTVLEHRDRPGIKLAITGNGRCNYTNTEVSAKKYHCSDEGFVGCVLKNFDYEACITFFKELGIEPLIRHYGFDDGGYVYPESEDASAFRDALYNEALRLGVKFIFNVSDQTAVDAVIDNARHTELQTAEAAAGYAEGFSKGSYDSVIIAAGSNAYPKTGSDSSIYPALKALGIKMNRFLPALCALFSKDAGLSEMKGKRIRTEPVLRIDDTECCSCSGEVQFNEHSISGIPVMQLSRYASIALNQGRKVELTVCGHAYPIHRTAGFDRAQVCAGGVDTAQIDAETMNLRGSNIYFCGEILNVDGECGGYNLHFAWASGYTAGISAAGGMIENDKNKPDKAVHF